MKSDMELIANKNASRAVSKLFSGEVPAKNSGCVNPWHGANRSLRDDMIADLHLWADLEELTDDKEILELADSCLLAGNARKEGRRWRGLAVAAGVLLCVLSVLWLSQGNIQPDDGNALRYVSRIGEVKTVSLSDGSEMSLNTGSEVLFVEGEAERTVILQRGEAFFDVARDVSRPFVVKSGDNAVTVLGTSFFVRKYPEKISISVVEGVVASHSVSEKALPDSPLVSGLSPNKNRQRQLRIPAGWAAEIESSTQKLISGKAVAQDEMQDWISGVLSFKREELYKIVKELNRYSAKKILIEDKSIVDLTTSAVIKIDSLNAALAGLELSLPIKVTHHFDKIAITKR